jgi:hypothetical protein
VTDPLYPVIIYVYMLGQNQLGTQLDAAKERQTPPVFTSNSDHAALISSRLSKKSIDLSKKSLLRLFDLKSKSFPFSNMKL